MAYTRHNWVCGEVINDTKMNNIEDGIQEALECCGSGGGLVFILSEETGTCDGHDYNVYNITYQDFINSAMSGTPIWYAGIAAPTSESTHMYAVVEYQAFHNTTDDYYQVDLRYVVNGQFEDIGLYCDTVDGYMRNYNCWDDGFN